MPYVPHERRLWWGQILVRRLLRQQQTGKLEPVLQLGLLNGPKLEILEQMIQIRMSLWWRLSWVYPRFLQLTIEPYLGGHLRTIWAPKPWGSETDLKFIPCSSTRIHHRTCKNEVVKILHFWQGVAAVNESMTECHCWHVARYFVAG